MNPYAHYFCDPKGSTKLSFAPHFGFKRTGINYLQLAPGERSSLPHAESLEEEFVYVLSGHPHVWIDGFVYPLGPNWAAGFPAGTGIAHNFINNSETVVELLVVGERTKKDNLCSFPLNPEQEQISKIWWPDAPKRTLGPHDGTPHPVQSHELGAVWPSCLVDVTQLRLSSGWHYPGDSETFGHCVRLTDALGLKALGLGYEVLAPGHRSAFPHAHKSEEEFAWILSGQAEIWMNGFLSPAPAGTCVGFVPGTNIAHSIINDTNQSLTYLIVGEAQDVDEPDQIYYPLHPFRNEQCRQQNAFWESRPRDVEFGPHRGRPRAGLRDHLSLRHVSPTDTELLLDIFRASPEYFRRVEGVEPTRQSVQVAMTDGPKIRGPRYKKEFLMVEWEDAPVGVLDLHIDHPEPGMAYLGLLLIREDHFGRGLGRRATELAHHYLKFHHGITSVRLGVSQENDVSSFWSKMGYGPNGRTYKWKGEAKSTEVIELERRL